MSKEQLAGLEREIHKVAKRFLPKRKQGHFMGEIREMLATLPPPSAPVGVESAAADAGHVSFESMKQCADAWRDVAGALNATAPGWDQKEGSGSECAVAAIHALAQQPAPVEVPIDVMYEYLDARACYDAATKKPNSHAPAPVLKHDDPDARRLREARVALDNAIAFAQQSLAEAQERPAKPAECADGCPDQQVCDHCQWPPGPDAEAQAQGGGEVNVTITVRDGEWVGTYAEWCRRKQIAPPSAPVGVEGLVAIYDAAFEKCDNDPDDRISPKWRAIEAVKRALAQQPAASHPSFTAGDMADAAAQGFRDGVASVGETVGVEGFDEWFDEYTKNNYTDEMLALAAWKQALAQQPAAVDDAMQRLRTERNRKLWQADLVGGHISVDRMRLILTAALADKQPATDGGFSAADMMDARSEGRQEGQQLAGFSAGDMADAAAQGFRDGVASVGPAAVDEAMVRKVAKAINAELEGEENFALAWQRLGSNERRLRDRMARAAIAALELQQGGRSDE